MVRWASLLVLLILVLAPTVLAHKSPVVEYGKAGVWRTGYSFMPRQAVVNEPITLYEQVEHYEGEIEGEVRAHFTVYKDDSTNPWYNGKQYKQLDWLVIHDADGTNIGDNKFTSTFIVDQPGNYMVTIDLYEDGQYMGQDIRAIDVEKRTIGPMYMTFSAIILVGVLVGVRKRVL
jgi:hypothetical protein